MVDCVYVQHLPVTAGVEVKVEKVDGFCVKDISPMEDNEKITNS